MNKFDYFYGREVEQYKFVKVPMVFFEDERYFEMSSDAKLLYAIMLDRATLSFKNGWIDEEKRVYIIFTIDEMMKKLNKSNKTIIKVMLELELKYGLIEKKRLGFNKPNIIYVKDFMSIYSEENTFQEVNNLHIRSEKVTLQEVKNLHLRNEESTLQEVKGIQPNHTNNNYTNYNQTNNSYTEYIYCGSFENVKLYKDDYMMLKSKLGNRLEDYIERLSLYIRSTGKAYKDHAATILSWYQKDKQDEDKLSIGKRCFTLADYEADVDF